MEFFTSGLSTYVLVLAAEFGDKSQLVCLFLAARHGSRPVFIGAILAFALLTALAVVVGGTLGSWIPEAPLHFVVAALFALFGIQLLRSSGGSETDQTVNTVSKNAVLTTFILIALSEMGDKTQLLVVGLSTVDPASQVFVGATLALATTSALGVWAGSRMLTPRNLKWVHRIGALLFILFALIAAYQGVLAL